MESLCLLEFPLPKKTQNKTQKKDPNKQTSEMSSRQIQKGNSKALQGVYDRLLFPCAIPMIRAKQLGVKKKNNEGI